MVKIIRKWLTCCYFIFFLLATLTNQYRCSESGINSENLGHVDMDWFVTGLLWSCTDGFVLYYLLHMQNHLKIHRPAEFLWLLEFPIAYYYALQYCLYLTCTWYMEMLVFLSLLRPSVLDNKILYRSIFKMENLKQGKIYIA